MNDSFVQATNDNPLVSILIPVYNREKIIIETLTSALNQSYKNIEIIVVDNRSTDNTYKIISDFSKNHMEIKVYQNEKNIGPVNNWKRCFELAHGEYGKILFSDDLMESDYLEQTLPYMKNNNIGFVFSSALIGPTKENSRVWYKWQRKSGIYPAKLFIDDVMIGKELPFSPGAALFRLKDLKENLIATIPSPTYHDFESHGAGSDLLLYLMTCISYSHVVFLAEPLVFFRIHNDSITIKNFDMVKERYYQAKLYFADHINNRQLMLNLLIYLWIGNILKNKFLKFSSFCQKYYHGKNSFTFGQWLKGFYFLLNRSFKKFN